LWTGRDDQDLEVAIVGRPVEPRDYMLDQVIDRWPISRNHRFWFYTTPRADPEHPSEQ